ncbi:MAG: DNA-packaging protein [Clostridia bacterium]|jgi:hypothetical protein|nr:DNA-packaging protein [Clostridia bacterium]
MTDAEKTTMLTNMTGETDSSVLSTYLSLAEGVVIRKAFPFGDGSEEMPAKYDRTQVEIAAYMLNKRGAEGEKVHNENGVIRHYEDGDIPPTLLRRILPMGEVL